MGLQAPTFTCVCSVSAATIMLGLVSAYVYFYEISMRREMSEGGVDSAHVLPKHPWLLGYAVSLLTNIIFVG